MSTVHNPDSLLFQTIRFADTNKNAVAPYENKCVYINYGDKYSVNSALMKRMTVSGKVSDYKGDGKFAMTVRLRSDEDIRWVNELGGYVFDELKGNSVKYFGKDVEWDEIDDCLVLPYKDEGYGITMKVKLPEGKVKLITDDEQEHILTPKLIETFLVAGKYISEMTVIPSMLYFRGGHVYIVLKTDMIKL